MSYMQADAAIDACLIMATANIDMMDPDEIETFARQCVADGKCTRDDFDKNGYDKTESDHNQWECSRASDGTCTEDNWYDLPSGSHACDVHDNG